MIATSTVLDVFIFTHRACYFTTLEYIRALCALSVFAFRPEKRLFIMSTSVSQRAVTSILDASAYIRVTGSGPHSGLS